jgi:presenilin-like A22 family membrane protease
VAALSPQAKDDVIITHPNRDKPIVRSTRVVVILLMALSAALVAVITIGGWKVLENAWIIQVAYVVIYVLLAYYAGRWNRGVLPVVSSLAVLLIIFALVSGPSWFDRDKSGFVQPALNAGFLGTLTFLIVPVQILLIIFAMRGFSQGWNVEVEQRRDGNAGELSANPA